MWLHPDPTQALGLAVRCCAIGQLVGLVELVLVRGELADSGFLDWTMIGNLSPRTRTRAGAFLRRRFRALSRGAFAAIVVADFVVVAALLAWPGVPELIAAAVALQLAILKRHHLTIDGSDQMTLVVLCACMLGRIGGDPASLRAAVSFLAAELVLSYVVAGLAKACSSYWRSGEAFTIIAQTRMYGQPLVARLMRARPSLGRAAGYNVLAWESVCFVALTAPPPVVVALLAVGLGFHLGCAFVMGLNRFVWAFAAGYPALLCTNTAIRGWLGATTCDRISLVALLLGALAVWSAGGVRGVLERDRPANPAPAPRP
jgi:hypothetical protein